MGLFIDDWDSENYRIVILRKDRTIIYFTIILILLYFLRDRLNIWIYLVLIIVLLPFLVEAGRGIKGLISKRIEIVHGTIWKTAYRARIN